MKFGIFYELQLPRPWEEGDELRLYQNALTQLETADRLGYESIFYFSRLFKRKTGMSPSAFRKAGAGETGVSGGAAATEVAGAWSDGTAW